MDTPELDTFLNLRTLSFQQVKETYRVKESDITPDSRFQKLSGLTKISTAEVFPAWFFFRENKIALIYISDPSLVSKLNANKITKKYGEEIQLRSPGGKRARLLVYPEHGFAISELDDEIQFIQIFQPTSLERFNDEIYEEVGPYIR